MPDLLPPEEGTDQSPAAHNPPDIMAELAAFLDRFIGLAALPMGVVFTLACVGVSVALLLHSVGITHGDLGPPWHDFQSFWSAGVAAIHGNGGKIYDYVWHSAHIKQVIGAGGQDFGWHYPPQFLLLLAHLALLPLPLAFLLWALLPLAGFAWLVYRLIPDWRAPLIAMGCPILTINAGYVQNGVLSTALIGFALLPFVEGRKPSALSTALLAFKPHLGLVFPVAFVSQRLWASVGLTAIWLLVQMGLTALVFGPQIWLDFWHSLAQSKDILLSVIGAGEYQYVSVFGSVRLLGGSTALAYVIQALGAGLSLYVLWTVWRGDTARPLKAALLVATIPLTAPYLMHYDLVMAVLACVLLVRHRDLGLWQQRDRFHLACLWLFITFNHGLQKDFGLPAGLVFNLLLYALVIRMIRNEGSGPPVSHSAVSDPESAH